MKIYTKTGDMGTTALVGGTRISKADLRLDTYGTIDELNAWIGLLSDQAINEQRKPLLKEIQDRLFTIGAELASEPTQTKKKIPDLYESDVELLEQAIDRMNEQLLPLRAFILPGGHQNVSFAHLARTVCRRAERVVVQLAETETIPTLIIKYLNRLSDYLFVLARILSKELDAEEITWQARLP